MKILFLSTRVPYARSSSGHQIVYQRISRLIRNGHQVGLAALQDPGEALPDDPLRDQLLECVTVPVPERAARFRRAKDYIWSRVPPPFWPYRVPELYRIVGDCVDRTGYELVVAEFVAMGQYLYRNPWLPAVRKVISTHACASMASRTPLVLPERTWLTAAREHLLQRDLARYEFELYRSVDQVWTLSHEDRFTLMSHAPELRVAVIPVGIDLEYFTPTIPWTPGNRLLLTGQFADEANQDGFMWFVSRAWPLIRARYPDLVFTVLGANVTPTMKALAKKTGGVELPGQIEDIRPYLADTRIFVCPVRMGSGLRVRILEAMAAGVPVVSTSTAAAGIPVQSGVNIWLADDPDIMAESIGILMNDPVLSLRIAENASRMVRERFNWDRGIARLEQTIEDFMR